MPLISTVQPKNLSKEDPPIIMANTAAEAAEKVHKQLPLKPDFIKFWYIAGDALQAEKNLPVMKAAIDEATKNGLQVLVHATDLETAKLAVEAGATILVHSIDDKLIDASLGRLFKDKNITYIPTLQVTKNYMRVLSQQFNFSDHDFKYANPFMMGTTQDLMHIDPNDVIINYKDVRQRIDLNS